MMKHIKYEIKCCSDCPFWRYVFCQIAPTNADEQFEMPENHNEEVAKSCPLKSNRVTVGLKKVKQ